MESVKYMLLVVCIGSFALQIRGENLDDDEGRSLRSLLRRQIEEEELESLMKKSYTDLEAEKRGAFDCNEKNQKCSVVSKCCGTLQCYWEDGFSMRKSGICVECVALRQRCQRDSQCCQGLVCQKGRMGYTDGLCDVKRPRGGSCHENDQCASNDCRITAWQVLSREEGTCA